MNRALPADRELAPSVLVLLATRNGIRWLDEQLDSLFRQADVRLMVVASDDGSTDGTLDRLHARAADEPLLVMDVAKERLGSANSNFLRLIRDAPLGEATHIALCDQDDIWDSGKCRRACDAMAALNLDAYSSDVTAFWADGRQMYIRKSFAPREYDHLFESAGPGCTFVLNRQIFEALRSWVRSNFETLRHANVHDWLIYAHGRTQGWRWYIDPKSTLRYRQHRANEFGANAGARAGLRRLGRVLRGCYRQDVLRIASLVGDSSWVSQALRRFDLSDRLRLAANANQLRRRPRDRLVLALLLLTMRRC